MFLLAVTAKYRSSFGVVSRERPVLLHLLTLPSSWNRYQSLDMTLCAIPSSSDTSSWVRPYSSRPKILPSKESSKCFVCAITMRLLL
ncbi:hypothetical protein TNCV_3592901 [Trichonephila clavipes]|nr:hypothetical protein TNCV_3592901 [Trichonephila clavipes]